MCTFNHVNCLYDHLLLGTDDNDCPIQLSIDEVEENAWLVEETLNPAETIFDIKFDEDY